MIVVSVLHDDSIYPDKSKSNGGHFIFCRLCPGQIRNSRVRTHQNCDFGLFSKLQVRSLCGDGDSVLNTYVFGFLKKFIDNNLNYKKFGFSSFHVRICARGQRRARSYHFGALSSKFCTHEFRVCLRIWEFGRSICSCSFH